LDEDEFNPKYVKVLISTRLDGEVLEAVKVVAKQRGVPYQTLINQTLRDQFIGNAAEEKIRTIIRDEMKKAI
jgi:predicted DNA binding CopG/RHH family protein